MAYAYLVVSPPDMGNNFEEVWQLHLDPFELSPSNSSQIHNTSFINWYPFQMAKAASNKTSTKTDLKYPEIEEDALQFILDSCETSISKYSRFLKVKNKNKTAHLSLWGKSCTPSTYGLLYHLIVGKWINGFGHNISKTVEPKSVSETASCRLVH